MAKRKPTPEPPVSQCWTVPKAAEELKVARTTLASAIEAGRLTTHRTACGRDLVTLEDCRAFLDSTPGRGFCDPEVRAKAGRTRGEKPKAG